VYIEGMLIEDEVAFSLDIFSGRAVVLHQPGLQLLHAFQPTLVWIRALLGLTKTDFLQTKKLACWIGSNPSEVNISIESL
jgi:hypothetical protein